jgi:hypothetical protein
VTLVTLSIPLAFIASIQVDEINYFTAETTLTPGDFKSLIQIFETAEIYSGKVVNITIINLSGETALITVSCMNESTEYTMKPGDAYTINSPYTPCTLSSKNTSSRLRITLVNTVETMPYKWLTVISLSFFIAGTSLMMTYVAYRVSEKTMEKNSESN